MEKLHSLLRRCREFSEHHTWSPLKEVEQVVRFSRGLFVLGTSPDGEHEVAWDARVLEDSRLSEDEARRWVMDSDRLALGLYLVGGLQGVLLAKLCGPRQKTFFVRSLGVDEERRRQGWGRRLMRTALRWAGEHGARRLPLNPFNGGTERCP